MANCNQLASDTYPRLDLRTILVRHRNNLFSIIDDEYNRSEDAMRITMKKTRRRLRGQVKTVLNIGWIKVTPGTRSLMRSHRTNFDTVRRQRDRTS
jgi:hypothetical protein